MRQMLPIHVMTTKGSMKNNTIIRVNDSTWNSCIARDWLFLAEWPETRAGRAFLGATESKADVGDDRFAGTMPALNIFLAATGIRTERSASTVKNDSSAPSSGLVARTA